MLLSCGCVRLSFCKSEGKGKFNREPPHARCLLLGVLSAVLKAHPRLCVCVCVCMRVCTVGFQAAVLASVPAQCHQRVLLYAHSPSPLFPLSFPICGPYTQVTISEDDGNSPYSFLAIALIAEAPAIFVTKRAELLTPCMECVVTLIYPLQPIFVYITVLPAQLGDLIHVRGLGGWTDGLFVCLVSVGWMDGWMGGCIDARSPISFFSLSLSHIVSSHPWFLRLTFDCNGGRLPPRICTAC